MKILIWIFFFRHLDLCANPFVNQRVYNQFPKEVKLLVSDHMMTPEASVHKLKTQIDWFTQMGIVEKAFTPPDNLPEGKFQCLKDLLTFLQAAFF